MDIIDLYQIDISGPSLILSVTKGVLQKKNTLRTGVPDSIGPDPQYEKWTWVIELVLVSLVQQRT